MALRGLARRHLAEDRDADVQRPGHGVAAHQFDALRVGQREQAAREAGQEDLVGTRQGQCQGATQRLGTAGSQVGQVHRQRLVAQALGGHGGQEVPPRHQHVAGHGPLLPRSRHQQGAVVAHAQGHAGAGGTRAHEVTGDELEFAQALRRRCAHGRVPGSRRGSRSGSGVCGMGHGDMRDIVGQRGSGPNQGGRRAFAAAGLNRLRHGAHRPAAGQVQTGLSTIPGSPAAAAHAWAGPQPPKEIR